jgi:hypothetical protein
MKHKQVAEKEKQAKLQVKKEKGLCEHPDILINLID